MRYRPFLVAILGMAWLSGCAAPPPPPPPTVVNVTLNAASDVNPGPDGRGAPVQIYVYQLSSSSGFNSAEFFPLFQHDADTLKSDLIHKDSFLLAPGASKSTTLTPDPPVKAIGVFAAYRDFQHVTWRGSADVPANKTTNITVTAGHDGITVKAEPAPPKPAS